MTKNGLKKSDAATFLLDLVFQSQTYMVETKSKYYLLEELIKLKLLFHLQVKKKEKIIFIFSSQQCRFVIGMQSLVKMWLHLIS